MYNISGHVDVKANSTKAFVSALAMRPVSVAVDAAGSAWQLYKGGIMKPKTGMFGSGCKSDQLDHGVLAVAFDKAEGWYKIKNSWGTTWGEQGYIRVQ